jgi:hypothetical protein
MPSFGSSTGSGVGTQNQVGNQSLQFAYPYENTTGGYVYVDTIDLHNVVAPLSGPDAYVAIYSDNAGVPWGLLGTSDLRTGAFTAGTNTFVFSTPVAVADGARVWVVTAFNGTIYCSGVLLTGEGWFASRGYTTSPRYSDPFAQSQHFGRSGTQLPVVLSGSAVGPTPTTNLREAVESVEGLSEGSPNVREALGAVEGLSEGMPNVREALFTIEGASEGYPNIRQSLYAIESLHPVAPEPHVSTEVFPALLGLAFSVHKKPRFDTRIAKSVSGREVRNAFMQYPIWTFELTYDYLPDRTAGVTDLKNLQGFFLKRQGSFDTFLYLDPDDNTAVAAPIGTGDGVTTQFYWARDMGGFVEPVGQINTALSYVLYYTDAEAHTVPVTPGPYTVTVTNSADFVEDLGVTIAGVPMTLVTGAPAAGQYSHVLGVYTFNAAQQGVAIAITYRYTASLSDYAITMPNLMVFVSAPPLDRIITADFHYYFVCRFSGDEMDFEKFMDKLWNLQTCSFESVLQ